MACHRNMLSHHTRLQLMTQQQPSVSQCLSNAASAKCAMQDAIAFANFLNLKLNVNICLVHAKAPCQIQRTVAWRACRNSTGLFMRQHMMNFANLDKMIDSHLMSTHLEVTLLSPETKHHHLISNSGRSTTGETTLKSQYLTSCKQYTAAVSTHKTVPRQALQRRAVMHQTGKCILIAGQWHSHAEECLQLFSATANQYGDWIFDRWTVCKIRRNTRAMKRNPYHNSITLIHRLSTITLLL